MAKDVLANLSGEIFHFEGAVEGVEGGDEDEEALGSAFLEEV